LVYFLFRFVGILWDSWHAYYWCISIAEFKSKTLAEWIWCKMHSEVYYRRADHLEF